MILFFFHDVLCFYCNYIRDTVRTQQMAKKLRDGSLYLFLHIGMQEQSKTH